jgi:hypothetical protein
VFTARYALSPYIKQIRSVFEGLNKPPINKRKCTTVIHNTRPTAYKTFATYMYYKCDITSKAILKLNAGHVLKETDLFYKKADTRFL